MFCSIKYLIVSLIYQKRNIMTTTIYSRKKNTEVKTYKMISDTMGFMFKFSTDDAERFMNDYKEYHGYKVDKYTYEEAK
jgi:hypothetical protein